MNKRSFLGLGIALLGVSLPLWAHHGFAGEYEAKSVTLVGKLTKVELENPHGWLYIDAKADEGNVINWALELPGPAVLRRNGFDQHVFQDLQTSGEIVTVSAYPARDGSKHAFGGTLTRADGKTVISLGRPPQRSGYGRGQDNNPQ